MQVSVKRVLSSSIIFLAAGVLPLNASAQAPGQKTFASSKQAVDAFIQAVKAGNTNEVKSMLGPDSDAILSSGDAVADKAARDAFLARYDKKHVLVSAGKNKMALDVGEDDWPFPVPLVNQNGKWYFDGAAGKEEIVYRRIGRNELSAIEVCKGVVAAQRDYIASSHDGAPAGKYATRVLSTPGKQDGLYWETKPGEKESPAGPLLAEASKEGYQTTGKQTPYHGYYYHMLLNPEGFAFLAYPAEYKVSGVMTFVVTQTGEVLQKDLGPDTTKIASRINDYQIDGTWKPAM